MMQLDIRDKKIIVDADTGVDDALAILMLAKLIPNKILGITTSGGNADVNMTTQNTLDVLGLVDSKIKVYKGAGKTLLGRDYIYSKDYHGENGLANVVLDKFGKAEKESAEDFIIDAAEKYGKKLLIIGLTPPTNIAKALMKNPEIAENIEAIVLMGGAVNVSGNETSSAEFNFYQDPEAVKVIFEKIKNVYIVPLDVTNKCLIEKQDIDKISNKSKGGRFTRELILNWYNIFGSPKKRFFELYDPLAVSVVLGNFLEFSKASISIETFGCKKGGLIKGNNVVFWARKIKKQKFMNLFFNTI